jgi:hypothetical protein
MVKMIDNHTSTFTTSRRIECDTISSLPLRDHLALEFFGAVGPLATLNALPLKARMLKRLGRHIAIGTCLGFLLRGGFDAERAIRGFSHFSTSQMFAASVHSRLPYLTIYLEAMTRGTSTNKHIHVSDLMAILSNYLLSRHGTVSNWSF